MEKSLFRTITVIALVFLSGGCETQTDFSTTSQPALIEGKIVKDASGLSNAFPCIKPDQNIRDNEITTDRITLDAGHRTVYVAYQGSAGGGGLFTVGAMWYTDPIPMEALLGPNGRYEVNYTRSGMQVTFEIADKGTGAVVGRSNPAHLKLRGQEPVDWQLYTPNPVLVR